MNTDENMTLIGKGRTAEVFDIGNKKALKLFLQGYSEMCVDREYKNAQIINDAGIPSPKAYEKVKKDGRFGIVYDRLYGTDLLTGFMQDHNGEYLLNSIVEVHKQILAHKSKELDSYKNFYRMVLYKDTPERQAILNTIDSLPEGDFICHGDFHPGNIWRNPDDSNAVIDFVNVCKAPWEYDVTRSYYLITEDGTDDMASDQTIKEQKLMLGNMYLEAMNVNKEDIAQYLNVIALCRKYELAD